MFGCNFRCVVAPVGLTGEIADSNPITLTRFILAETKHHKQSKGDFALLLQSIQLVRFCWRCEPFLVLSVSELLPVSGLETSQLPHSAVGMQGHCICNAPHWFVDMSLLL